MLGVNVGRGLENFNVNWLGGPEGEGTRRGRVEV